MWAILGCTFFLTFFSIISLFGTKPFLVANQLTYYAIGLIAFFVVRKIGLPFFRHNAKLFYWIFIGLLIFTFLVGLEIKGSRRWIDLYFFNFQPSEFFKIFFTIFIADYFVRHQKDIDSPQILFKSFLYFALPAFIVLRQPDLGNAAVFAVIYMVILFFSGVPKKGIVYSMLFFAACLPLFWLTLHDYQKARVMSFVNPSADLAGAGYNMAQSMITAGSGKFLGKGLGRGTQSKLFFLPENHTDFAFSSLVEQFGFFGGICILTFYFILAMNFIRKLVVQYRQRGPDELFKFLYTLGIFAFFIIQVFVNIAMNIGLFPVTGIALPFVSYGGSLVVGFMIGLALLPK